MNFYIVWALDPKSERGRLIIRAKGRSVMAPSPCGWHPHVATRRSLIASQFPLRSFALCVSTPVRVGVPAKVCLGGRLARQNCKRSLFDPKLSCLHSCALGMSPGGRWYLLSARGSKPALLLFPAEF